jgi:hypothetical protein
MLTHTDRMRIQSVLKINAATSSQEQPGATYSADQNKTLKDLRLSDFIVYPCPSDIFLPLQ